MAAVTRYGWAALILLVPAAAQAQGRSFTDRPVPGMRQMDRHNPFSRDYVDMTPGGYARRSFGYGPHYNGYSYYGSFYGPSFYEPFGYFDYGYFPPPYPYGVGVVQAYPLVIPSQTMFGLGATLNRLGIPPPTRAPQVIVAPPSGVAAEPAKPKAVNAETLARAGRLLSAGDEHFAAQRYRDANVRYRSATEIAPELVEAYFRQGQALLASGQYEFAGKAFKRGMMLGDQWPQANFNLTELYGANDVARTAHLEAVAAAAADAPHDGTLWLLAALQLHFGGQPERAVPLFRRASELLPGEDLNLDTVLKPAK